MKKLLLIMSLLGLASASHAEEAPLSAREQLRHFGAGLDSLGAEFEQVVTGADGALVDDGAGTVYLRRPDRFRWTYEGEFPEVIIADGERIWLYDEALEQVTVRAQSSLAADSPLMLLTDPEGLESQFTVTELGTIGGAQLLELAATDTETEFDRVLISFADNRPVSMIMEDAFGMRTEIRFGNVERNPVLAEDLFTFVPPEGVDVVGDIGDEAMDLR